MHSELLYTYHQESDCLENSEQVRVFVIAIYLTFTTVTQVQIDKSVGNGQLLHVNN
jgi:hypothetical protein